MIKHIKDRIEGKAIKGQKRSSSWRTIRNEFIEINPTCYVCGGTKKLEVHHIIPFNVDPRKELEWSNLLTLCERKKYGINCHLLVGHLGNYRKWNPYIRADGVIWNEKIKGTYLERTQGEESEEENRKWNKMRDMAVLMSAQSQFIISDVDTIHNVSRRMIALSIICKKIHTMTVSYRSKSDIKSDQNLLK